RNVRHLAGLRGENERLRAQVEEFQSKERLIAQLESENDALKRQLNFVPEESFGYITATVVADSAGSFVRSILIKAGTEGGVRKGQAVVTGDGLVGRVHSVGQKSARVILVEDLNSRIPVMLQETRKRAILAGNNTKLPTLLYLSDKEDIKPGE